MSSKKRKQRALPGKVGHPAAGCTKPQREAFEAIAVGQHVSMGPKTRDALLARGLIEKRGDRTVGMDGFGKINIPIYEVPIPVHAQWCAWCAENVPDEEMSA